MKTNARILTLTALLIALLTLSGPALADTLTLPASLKTIEAEAFMGDTSLDEVVLPEGIESIGSRAFANSSVKTVNLPATLTSIADDAFDGVTEITVAAEQGTAAYEWAVAQGLIEDLQESPVEDFEFIDNGDGTCTIKKYIGNETEVIVPRHDGSGNTVESINDFAFNYKSNITSIVLPDGLEIIGNNTFYECRNLISISMPNTVHTIGEWAFGYCRKLKEITLPNSLTSVSAHMFYDCWALSNIIIPDNVSEIGSYAFFGASDIRKCTEHWQ